MKFVISLISVKRKEESPLESKLKGGFFYCPDTQKMQTHTKIAINATAAMASAVLSPVSSISLGQSFLLFIARSPLT